MKFRFKRRKRVEQRQLTLKDIRSWCFFTVATDLKDPKHEIITIYEGESEEHERYANKMCEEIKKNGKSVTYINDRDPCNQIHEKYDRYTKKTEKISIKPTVPVDVNTLIDAIKTVGMNHEGGVLPPNYFPVIYKLLKEGLLGTGCEKLTSRKFRNEMVNDFKTKKDSDFSKYKPKGNYPKWHLSKVDFPLKCAKKEKEALDFAEQFMDVYNDIRRKSLEKNS